jgi:hypothetical protein
VKEVSINSIRNNVNEHRQKWINHLDRVTDERVPKEILQYDPKEEERV